MAGLELLLVVGGARRFMLVEVHKTRRKLGVNLSNV